MSSKPVFVATHPRACSTAFERVFMTCRDTIQCVHEPFGDAWYYGPEMLAGRFNGDEKARHDSGFRQSTYKTIMDRLERENSEDEDKRVLIKDMAQYFFPPVEDRVSIAPSLIKPATNPPRRGIGTETQATNGAVTNGASTKIFPFLTQSDIKPESNTTPKTVYSTPVEPTNPTVVPTQLLSQFHWAFLIRHPRNAIPSYFRCCIPPLSDVTGFDGFSPAEAGYRELRQLFEYLRSEGIVGPNFAQYVEPRDWARGSLDMENRSQTKEQEMDAKHDICIIDADDLLDHPKEVIAAFCASVGIPYSDQMLNWDNEEEHQYAKDAFEKWKGFHEDAIGSRDLKPRQHKTPKSDEDYYNTWVEKYGKEGADLIKQTVEDNVADYEYLKQFAVKVA